MVEYLKTMDPTIQPQEQSGARVVGVRGRAPGAGRGTRGGGAQGQAPGALKGPNMAREGGE